MPTPCCTNLLKKMDLINKLFNALKDYINIRTTNLSNELLEILKIIENCASCNKDTIKEIYNFDSLINEIESEKDEQKKIKNMSKNKEPKN
jgi:hypothetical protein